MVENNKCTESKNKSMWHWHNELRSVEITFSRYLEIRGRRNTANPTCGRANPTTHIISYYIRSKVQK